MDREELREIIKLHAVHHTWCYFCNRHVGRQSDHLVDVLMPEGVEYLLNAREL